VELSARDLEDPDLPGRGRPRITAGPPLCDEAEEGPVRRPGRVGGSEVGARVELADFAAIGPDHPDPMPVRRPLAGLLERDPLAGGGPVREEARPQLHRARVLAVQDPENGAPIAGRPGESDLPAVGRPG